MVRPPRSLRPERLDTPGYDHTELAANLADIRTVNRWLGGSASIVRAVAPLCQQTVLPVTLLDVATGSADIPLALRAWARRQGVPLRVQASDVLLDVLREAQSYTGGAVPLVCHDALQMPYHDGAFDLITCAQAFHHFDPPGAVALLRELSRVARRAVVIGDLRRSWLAYGGAHLLGLVQRSTMSRHDGPLSALRAYTVREAADLARQAGLEAQVRAEGAFRLVMVVESV